MTAALRRAKATVATVSCNIAHLVRSAVDREHECDEADRGDLEPGESLEPEPFLSKQLSSISELCRYMFALLFNKSSRVSSTGLDDSSSSVTVPGLGTQNCKHHGKRGSKKPITTGIDELTTTSAANDFSQTRSPEVKLKNHAHRASDKRRKQKQKAEKANRDAPLAKQKIRSSSSLLQQPQYNIKTQFNAFNLSAARGGWIGHPKAGGTRPLTLAEVTSNGHRVVVWDGK